MERFLRRIGSAALVSVALYVSAVMISIVVAHIFMIARPTSGLGERIVAPVARTLEFLDIHWKSVLILIAPFMAPIAWDLLSRLRKAGSFEFDSVQLEPVGGVREKPPITPERPNE